MESLVCNFYLNVAARLSRFVPDIHSHFAGTPNNQQTKQNSSGYPERRLALIGSVLGLVGPVTAYCLFEYLVFWGESVKIVLKPIVALVLGLVGPVTVYCGWVSSKWSATFISVWQYVKLLANPYYDTLCLLLER